MEQKSELKPIQPPAGDCAAEFRGAVMGYENATSTKLLATNCAMCSRPLRDAQSVEAGIGPDCRERYGAPDAITEEARVEANKLIHRVAVAQDKGTAKLGIARLRELGCEAAAAKLETHWLGKPIVIAVIDGDLGVKSPYSEAFTSACRAVSGRRWNGEAKLNMFPASSAVGFVAALIAAYPGKPVTLPDGTRSTIDVGLDLSGFGEVAPPKLVAVKVTTDSRAELCAVWAPFDGALLAAFREIPGRCWDGEQKLTIFPLAARASVIEALHKIFTSITLVEEIGKVCRPSRRGHRGYC